MLLHNDDLSSYIAGSRKPSLVFSKRKWPVSVSNRPFFIEDTTGRKGRLTVILLHCVRFRPKPELAGFGKLPVRNFGVQRLLRHFPAMTISPQFATFYTKPTFKIFSLANISDLTSRYFETNLLS